MTAAILTNKLLITTATGKQGTAVINALQASSAPFQILALTRNKSSAKAQDLAKRPNVIVVEGDQSNPASIFKAHKIYGVFLVTTFEPGKENTEEKQASAIIDESIKNGVEHFVYSSVDRGGPEKSITTPTKIEHFASKYRIENYLKDKNKATGLKMKTTILRPVGFMDNMVKGFNGKGFTSMWKGVGEKPLQLISVHDIGVFAARVFANPIAYNGRDISLAGDELNFEQGKKVFKQSLGYDIPETFGIVGIGIKLMVKELGVMFDWFKTDGYGADVQALRKEEPKLQDFGTWLKESSDFRKN